MQTCTCNSSLPFTIRRKKGSAAQGPRGSTRRPVLPPAALPAVLGHRVTEYRSRRLGFGGGTNRASPRRRPKLGRDGKSCSHPPRFLQRDTVVGFEGSIRSIWLAPSVAFGSSSGILICCLVLLDSSLLRCLT